MSDSIQHFLQEVLYMYTFCYSRSNLFIWHLSNCKSCSKPHYCVASDLNKCFKGHSIYYENFIRDFIIKLNNVRYSKTKNIVLVSTDDIAEFIVLSNRNTHNNILKKHLQLQSVRRYTRPWGQHHWLYRHGKDMISTDHHRKIPAGKVEFLFCCKPTDRITL